MPQKPVDLIGAEIGWGAKLHGSAFAPKALRDYGLIKNLLKTQHSLSWRLVSPPIQYQGVEWLDYEKQQEQIISFSDRLAKITANSLANDHFPIVLGGDHTCAIGQWSGIIKQMDAQQRFGLIWIDAHMDAHTIKTTPSKAIHGMPLAVLLGHGEPQLVDIAIKGAKLSPQHVVLIGVRSFEEGEAALLKSLNVKVWDIHEVKKQGFKQIFNQAVAQVTQGTAGFGVSIDLDVFDPSIAPGVNAPVTDGLLLEDVQEAMTQLRGNSALKGFEIAEYNPERDADHKTAWLTQQLLQEIL